MYNACSCSPSFLYFLPILTVRELHLYFAIIDNHDVILTVSNLKWDFFVVSAALSQLSLP